jgi:uncharacterized membrane protein
LKIRIGSGLLPINLVVMVLILITILAPSSPPYNIFRTILGLPLVLFAPGYALVAALFPKKEGLENIERMALSFGLSIATVSLIGLILNYTPPGIKLEPVLYSTSGVTFIVSILAIWRRARLPEEDRFNISSGLKIPGWDGSVFGKLLSILVMISILGAIGTLGYYLASPKAEEPFTEFYILDLDSESQNYPTEFVITGDEVILVKYGENETMEASTGKVILGIINHEYEEATYLVRIMVNDEPIPVSFSGGTLEYIGPITLAHEEKWEYEIGFAPNHVGDNQKVEFILYKDDVPYFEEPLHIWIDVKTQD